MPINLEQVEFANEAFYLAFEAMDYNAMSHLWCEKAGSVCLHPGWPALIGREAILASWQKILSNPAQGQVSFYGAEINSIDENCAVVVCYEVSGGQVLVASNVFIEEDGRPKLFMHQSGFCSHPPAPDRGIHSGSA